MSIDFIVRTITAWMVDVFHSYMICCPNFATGISNVLFILSGGKNHVIQVLGSFSFCMFQGEGPVQQGLDSSAQCKGSFVVHTSTEESASFWLVIRTLFTLIIYIYICDIGL